MGKDVFFTTGFTTARVVLGWGSFVGSFFVDGLLSVLILQTIARVLP